MKLDPSGATLWSKRYGGDVASLNGIACDADDNIILVGNFRGEVDLGGGLLVGQEWYYDTFVLKLDPAGANLGSRVGTGPKDQVMNGIVLDPAGAPAVAGWYTESLDFGVDSVLMSTGEQRLFIAKFAF